MANPKITMVPTGKLIPYARNPRTHSDEQVGQIAASIKEFGWLVPAVVDADNVLIAGHGRILAAQKLGIDKIPTIDGSHLTPAQVQAFRIAENKLALNAGWDEELLKIELGDLIEADYGIDFTGFSDDEIAALLGDPLAGNTDPDDTPEPLPDPVSETGDVWILGPHRAMCGDATRAEDYERLMAGEKADMVFTDPPYNIAGMSKNVAASVRDSYLALKESDWDKDFDIIPALSSIYRVMSENCSVYIFTSHFLACDIWSWMEGWADHYGWCVWTKPNPMPSLMKRHWTWNAELVPYATRGRHIFNFKDGTHEPSTWRINKAQGNDKTGHPTQKPVAVPVHAISRSSIVGQVVLDPFGGSGSTLIACERLSRCCRMMEIDPRYVDVIVRRWQEFTGKQAHLEGQPEALFDARQEAVQE